MTWSMSRALYATVATLLGACTLEPSYHRPASPVPALDGTQGGSAAADIGWREFFPDPQLQRLIALALENNRDLRVAALNVESAQARYRIQRAELFPTIDASAVEQVQRLPPGASGSGAGPQLQPGTGSTLHFYNVGVGFTSYELDFFGRIRSLNHAALEQYFGFDETRLSARCSLTRPSSTSPATH
jgi:outer membrane protein, multidrug efflux system